MRGRERCSRQRTEHIIFTSRLLIIFTSRLLAFILTVLVCDQSCMCEDGSRPAADIEGEKRFASNKVPTSEDIFV